MNDISIKELSGEIRQAIEQLEAKPEIVGKLLENAEYMRKTLLAGGLQVAGKITPILPILVGEAGLAVEMAEGLKKEGLIVTPIRPPTVMPGTCRLRLTVSAAHHQEELARALYSIEKVSRQLNIIE